MPLFDRYAHEPRRIQNRASLRNEIQHQSHQIGLAQGAQTKSSHARRDLLEKCGLHDGTAISHVLSAKHVPVEWNGVVYPDAWFEALAARLRGDNSAALKGFASARPQMEENVRADPTRGVPLSFLAIIDAGLGQPEQAIQEGKRACEFSSFKAHNLDAVAVRCNLAVVYASTGQNDLALAELSKLADRPAGGAPGNNAILPASYGDFRMNPLWDPLRSDPHFGALVKRLAPNPSH